MGIRVSPARLVIPALCLLLLGISACSEDVPGRVESVYELKLDPTEKNRSRIRDLLADPSHDVRATALNALVSLEEPDARQLAIAAVDDESGFVRSIAIKLLGDLDAQETTAALVQRLLDDPDPIVRQRAAESLTRFGNEQAAMGLTRGLGDPMTVVRLACVKGVRRLQPVDAIPALVRLVLEDSTWEIRVQATGALGGLGGDEIRPVLEKALDDPNEFVRSAAAKALKAHTAAAEDQGA